MIKKFKVQFGNNIQNLSLFDLKEKVLNFENYFGFKHYISRQYYFCQDIYQIHAYLDKDRKYVSSFYGSIVLNQKEKNLITSDLIKKYNLEIINDLYSIRCDKIMEKDLIFCNQQVIGNGSFKTKEWLLLRLENLYEEIKQNKDEYNDWQGKDFSFSRLCQSLSNFTIDCL